MQHGRREECSAERTDDGKRVIAAPLARPACGRASERACPSGVKPPLPTGSGAGARGAARLPARAARISTRLHRGGPNPAAVAPGAQAAARSPDGATCSTSPDTCSGVRRMSSTGQCSWTSRASSAIFSAGPGETTRVVNVTRSKPGRTGAGFGNPRTSSPVRRPRRDRAAARAHSRTRGRRSPGSCPARRGPPPPDSGPCPCRRARAARRGGP